MSLYTAVFVHVLSCTGSDSAFVSMHSPIPGVDDFPQIYSRQPFQGGAFYIIFDDMAVSRYQQFEILNETFNDTHRWQTFTFPIYVDDVPEDVEELNLTLSLLPDPTLPPGSVNVTPAVATVRILDLSCKCAGAIKLWFMYVYAFRCCMELGSNIFLKEEDRSATTQSDAWKASLP